MALYTVQIVHLRYLLDAYPLKDINPHTHDQSDHGFRFIRSIRQIMADTLKTLWMELPRRYAEYMETIYAAESMQEAHHITEITRCDSLLHDRSRDTFHAHNISFGGQGMTIYVHTEYASGDGGKKKAEGIDDVTALIRGAFGRNRHTALLAKSQSTGSPACEYVVACNSAGLAFLVECRTGTEKMSGKGTRDTFKMTMKPLGMNRDACTRSDAVRAFGTSCTWEIEVADKAGRKRLNKACRSETLLDMLAGLPTSLVPAEEAASCSACGRLVA